MEYRLGKIYNHSEKEICIEMADILTLDQFKTINFAISKISELDNNTRLLDFVLINESELRGLFSDPLKNFF